MRVLVLADTHAPRRWKSCPPEVAAQLRRAELILHAGDVCVPAVLDELAGYAPVHAVLGNNDTPDVAAWGAPPQLELDLAGVPVAMVHDSGPRTGRAARLRRQFPAASLVVFGHSHIPLDESSPDHPGPPPARADQSRAVQRIFNPGSPTDRRRQPCGTVGVLELADGQIASAQIITVG